MNRANLFIRERLALRRFILGLLAQQAGEQSPCRRKRQAIIIKVRKGIAQATGVERTQAAAKSILKAGVAGHEMASQRRMRFRPCAKNCEAFSSSAAAARSRSSVTASRYCGEAATRRTLFLRSLARSAMLRGESGTGPLQDATPPTRTFARNWRDYSSRLARPSPGDSTQRLPRTAQCSPPLRRGRTRPNTQRDARGDAGHAQWSGRRASDPLNTGGTPAGAQRLSSRDVRSRPALSRQSSFREPSAA